MTRVDPSSNQVTSWQRVGHFHLSLSYIVLKTSSKGGSCGVGSTKFKAVPILCICMAFYLVQKSPLAYISYTKLPGFTDDASEDV